jgi:hypothetical protein
MVGRNNEGREMQEAIDKMFENGEIETYDEKLAVEQEAVGKILEGRKAEGILKDIRIKHYRNFLEDSISVSSRLEESTGRKLDLLIGYFPKKFGYEGKQPLVDEFGYRTLSKEEIGAIYSHVSRYAKKVVKEKANS